MIRVLTVLSLYIALLGCVAQGPVNLRNDSDFSVEVIQAGKRIQIDDNTVKLDRADFDIVFRSNVPFKLLVNSSTDPISYNQSIMGERLDAISGFKNTGMAEGRFNEDFLLMPRVDAPQMWYFSDEKDHRFNVVSREHGHIKAERKIKNILEKRGEKIKIENWQGRELFFVFVNYEYKKQRIDKSRKVLRIVFKDATQKSSRSIDEELVALQKSMQVLKNAPAAYFLKKDNPEDSRYMMRWEKKVISAANKYYEANPEVFNIPGKVTVQTGINANGSIYKNIVLKSSGNQQLDNAVQEIINRAAPFEPLPDNIKGVADVVYIQKVWQFKAE